jgi:hypothetical protein
MMKERKNYFIETPCNFIIYDWMQIKFLNDHIKNLQLFPKRIWGLIVNKQITRILIF